MSKRAREIIFINFFGALHFFLTIYILSPYLAQFMSEVLVGLVFSAGALLSLLIFFILPKILRHFSLKQFALVLGLIQFTVLSILFFSPPLFVLIGAVIVLSALPALIAYAFDIFLEQATESEGSTGNVRGVFITVSSIALVLSPLAIGYILGDTNAYEKVFALSAATLLPFILLLFAVIQNTPQRKIETLSFFRTLQCLFQSRDVLLGASAHFIMVLFFSWVSIYIPLYLHSELGIAWSDLGWVFSVMLLPYVFLEFPIGVMADKWFGERELMMIGFAIMGMSLAMVSFITVPIVTLFLIAVLVLTRVGGAMAEITTETYFFKHVDGDDLNSIGLFRMLRPLGALAGPLIGSFVLIFVSLQSAFIVLGGICLLAIPLAFFIKDTR